MYEKLELCPICKNTQFKNHLICTDHSVTGESFALVQCGKCSLVFTNPRPDHQSLPKYYQSDQYISHSDKGNSLVNKAYKLVRKFTVRQKVKLISSYQKEGTILDYGCGTGTFLSECEKAGWHAIGYEPDPKASNQAKEKKLSLVTDIKTIDEKVDIITAWHVIEHVSDLKKTVKSLAKKLKPGGILFIAVPNINSYDAQYYKEYWAGYDVPRHLYHFSQASFKELVKKTKLKLVETLPMKFDSFYVSLLSEKYKTGSTNYLSALKTGLRSNKKAKETGEYSSLIYILKK